MATSSFENFVARASGAPSTPWLSGTEERPPRRRDGAERRTSASSSTGLARTARLTHLTLTGPEPKEALAAEALVRAQERLAEVGPRPPALEQSQEPPAESLSERLRRWLRLTGTSTGP